jgi:DNA modification methylase
VEGSQSIEEKTSKIEQFQDGNVRALITKAKIAGFGMNFQQCSNMAFIGLSDSWEAYYHCIRRCWRFGQERPVNVLIVLSDMEQEVLENVMRKEKEASSMREHLINNVQQYEKEELAQTESDFVYSTAKQEGPNYSLRLGDAAECLKDVEKESVGLSVFSPPFLSLYTYSATERDLGNSRTPTEFFEHFGFIMKELLRATMPGRNCCVHVAQIPAMLVRDGYIGMKDFRGQTIEAFEAHGWIYHGEVCIDKDPQAQAIRTKAKALMFKQLKKDASWLRPGLADFILVFRKPGENAVPVLPEIDNERWIQWARPIWYGIRESDTLNIAEARGDDDERHICPLQLDTIRRCIMLWSNPGELIADPFAGIGSTGYVALQEGRRFVGIELKQNYYETMIRNIQRAKQKEAQQMLFEDE